jgi:hypothetical protein
MEILSVLVCEENSEVLSGAQAGGRSQAVACHVVVYEQVASSDNVTKSEVWTSAPLSCACYLGKGDWRRGMDSINQSTTALQCTDMNQGNRIQVEPTLPLP